MNRKLCDICGHSTAAPNDDHGFGRVLVGDCLDCSECAKIFETVAPTTIPGPGEDGYALRDEEEADWRLRHPEESSGFGY